MRSSLTVFLVLFLFLPALVQADQASKDVVPNTPEEMQLYLEKHPGYFAEQEKLAAEAEAKVRAEQAPQLDAGKAAFDKGDYQTALQLLQPLAGKENPEAQRMLGLMYAEGKGVKQNWQEAALWYGRRAHNGKYNPVLYKDFNDAEEHLTPKQQADVNMRVIGQDPNAVGTGPTEPAEQVDYSPPFLGNELASLDTVAWDFELNYGHDVLEDHLPWTQEGDYADWPQLNRTVGQSLKDLFHEAPWIKVENAGILRQADDTKFAGDIQQDMKKYGEDIDKAQRKRLLVTVSLAVRQEIIHGKRVKAASVNIKLSLPDRHDITPWGSLNYPFIVPDTPDAFRSEIANSVRYLLPFLPGDMVCANPSAEHPCGSIGHWDESKMFKEE